MKKLLALIGFTAFGNAYALDGNELLNQCQALYRVENRTFTESDLHGLGNCAGFTSGVATTLAVFSKEINRGYCMPTQINTGQMVRVVLKFLEEHPERLHQSDFSLTYAALVSAYPCK